MRYQVLRTDKVADDKMFDNSRAGFYKQVLQSPNEEALKQPNQQEKRVTESENNSLSIMYTYVCVCYSRRQPEFRGAVDEVSVEN